MIEELIMHYYAKGTWSARQNKYFLLSRIAHIDLVTASFLAKSENSTQELEIVVIIQIAAIRFLV